ncbi:MAG: MerC domain-containing protein [Arenicella sp.]
MKITHIQTILDNIAIAFAVICTIHCLLLPLVNMVLPIQVVMPEWYGAFHQLFLIVVIPVSIISLTLGCEHHRKWHNVLLGFIGLCLLVFAVFLGGELADEFNQKMIAAFGAVIILFSQIRNYILCHFDQFNC